MPNYRDLRMRLLGLVMIVTGFAFGVAVVSISVNAQPHISFFLLIGGTLIAVGEILVGAFMLTTGGRHH